MSNVTEIPLTDPKRDPKRPTRQQVREMVKAGLTVQQIAAVLGITTQRVYQHVKAIRKESAA